MTQFTVLTTLLEMAKRSTPDSFYAAAKKKYGAEKVKALKWPEIAALAKELDVQIPAYLRTQKVGRGLFNLVPADHADTKPPAKKEAPKEEPKKEEPKEQKVPNFNWSISWSDWSEFYRELKKKFGDIEIERAPEHKRNFSYVLNGKTDEIIGVWEFTGSSMIPGRGRVSYGRGNMAIPDAEQKKLDARNYYGFYVTPRSGSSYISTGTQNSIGPWRSKDEASAHISDWLQNHEYDDEFDGGDIRVVQVVKTGGKWTRA